MVIEPEMISSSFFKSASAARGRPQLATYPVHESVSAFLENITGNYDIPAPRNVCLG